MPDFQQRYLMEYDIGPGASPFTHAFVDAFRCFGKKTYEHNRLRKSVFSEMSKQGKVRLSALQIFIATVLKQRYGDEEGRRLFDLYSPCYQHAYENARLLKKKRANKPPSASIQEGDDGIGFAEFRICIVFLCIYAGMFDIFSRFAGSSFNEKDTSNDVRISLKDFLGAYESVRTQGFTISTGLSSADRAAALFNEIDIGHRGYIILSEWVSFIKGQEEKQDTELGAMFSGKVKLSPASPSASNLSFGNSTQTSCLTSRSSKTAHSLTCTIENITTRETASLSGPIGKNGKSKRSKLKSGSRPSSSNTSSISRSTKSFSMYIQSDKMPETIAGIYTPRRKTMSKHYQRFLSTFQPYAEKFPKFSRLRKEGFSSCDKNGSGQINISETNAFVLNELKAKYGEVDGLQLFDFFRPACILAYKSAISFKKTKTGVYGDEHIGFSEFRIFNTCACIHGGMLDVFFKVKGGESPITTGDEKLLLESDWRNGYRHLKDSGFMQMINTADDRDDVLHKAFKKMDIGNDGKVSFAEFCACLHLHEIEKQTDLGKFLENDARNRTKSDGDRIATSQEEVSPVEEEGEPTHDEKAPKISSTYISTRDVQKEYIFKSTAKKKRRNSIRRTGDLLGLSVHYLSSIFVDEVKAEGFDPDQVNMEGIENLNGPNGIIRRKGVDTKCPLDGRKGASYVHSIADSAHIGHATSALIYSRRNTIGHIVGSLFEYCKSAQSDPMSTYIWIGCLCTNLHRVVEDRLDDYLSIADDESMMRFTLTGIRNVIVLVAPWKCPFALKQAWPLFQIYTAKTNDCKISISMPSSEQKSMMEAAGDKEEGKNDFQVLTNFDISKAESCVVWDKEMVLSLVDESCGRDSFNNEVGNLFKQWLKVLLLSAIHSVASKARSFFQDLDYARMCYGFGVIMRENGEWDLAVRYCQIALETQQYIYGNGCNNKELIASNYSMGEAYFCKGVYDQSLKYHLAALKMRKEMDGEVGKDRATSYMEAFAAHAMEQDQSAE